MSPETKPKNEKAAKKSKKPAEAPAAKPKRLMDTWKVLLYPSLTEKSMGMVETQNKLIFIVNRKADKEIIKNVVEKEFNVKVREVKIEITTKGTKKAYIRLAPEFSASDIASKLGMI
jgi:large subunit ribosomal protein L23